MVNNNRDKYPFLFVGLLILFVGWVSVFTGFAGFILAEDVDLFIELEDVILVINLVSEQDIQVQMAFRMIFGFILVFIGNSFLLESKGINKKFCRPCFDDVRKLK